MPATYFAPQLIIPNGVMTTDFYARAFNAVELYRWNNEDGSIHVAELSINEAIFHLHVENEGNGSVSPARHHGTTTTIGLFVEDVDQVISQAVQAGAVLVSSAQDYDYGYRQGRVLDPFSHPWLIEMEI